MKRPRTHTNQFINTDIFYPSGLARTVTFTFEVDPPVARSGETWVADVALVDQFGEEHTIEHVQFKTYGMAVWNKDS